MGLKFRVVAYGGFDRVRKGSIILRRSGGLSQFLVSVCGYIRICLAVYGSELIGGFGVEEKSQKQGESGLRSRKNKLWWFAECATPYNRTYTKAYLVCSCKNLYVLYL